MHAEKVLFIRTNAFRTLSSVMTLMKISYDLVNRGISTSVEAYYECFVSRAYALPEQWHTDSAHTTPSIGRRHLPNFRRRRIRRLSVRRKLQ